MLGPILDFFFFFFLMLGSILDFLDGVDVAFVTVEFGFISGAV
jgi:hypothetical protein